MTEPVPYVLKSPETDNEWRSYHEIRRKVLFEQRGLFGVYDENHPDDFRNGNYPMVLTHRGEPIGVIRVDIEGNLAIFRRVAVRDDMQRRGHGKAMLSLAEGFVHQKGIESIQSFVDPDAVSFYERCGFKCDESLPVDAKQVPMSKKFS